MLGAIYLCYEGAEKMWGSIRGHDADAAPVAEDELVSRGGPDRLGAVRGDHGDRAQRGGRSGFPAAADHPRRRRLGTHRRRCTASSPSSSRWTTSGCASHRPRPESGSTIGRGLVAAMPELLSALSAIGTVAMLWVGGHILLAGSDYLGWHAPYEVGPPCRGWGSPQRQGFWCGAGLVDRHRSVRGGWFGRRSRRRPARGAAVVGSVGGLSGLANRADMEKM